MSAMERMLMGAVANRLPPEVQQWLTPEGMKKLGDHVGALAAFCRNTQIIQVEQNAAILRNQQAIMEALNVGSSYDSGPKYGASIGDSDAARDAA